MAKQVIREGDEGVELIVRVPKQKKSKKARKQEQPSRSPVHVVYGGADRFTAATPRKLGDLAIAAMERYGGSFVEFANALGLPGAEDLSPFPDAVAGIERSISESPDDVRRDNFAAWLAWAVHSRTLNKLREEPVEDFRIDFEDGYGFRPDEEEDADAERAARELASAIPSGTSTPFCGFRIKSFAAETFGRAVRTLDIFLESFIEASGGTVPENFVVNLPKITRRREVAELCDHLKRIEKKAGLEVGTIGIELMIETPEALIDPAGRFAPRRIVRAGKPRVRSVHFGAYDYTSAVGIAGDRQSLNHPACDFARQVMLTTLSPLGIRLSDSVTTKLPVPIHRGDSTTEAERQENWHAVHEGWREHFSNVNRSMSNGYYQSWDLHPNQLPARYAAVYSFFLTGAESQARRLKGFIDKATQAVLSGNDFDDAASAQGMLRYFSMALRCGALDGAEVERLTGLTAAEINGSSFMEIAGSRR
ncbi:MAG TPA: aldolase/citrate lyase family protein [Pyrinomonadaceae bacterium]|nr:aldolase/citrate lyase family protein [Pyrinomonadaceae bacterium]